jgi:putative membrane protein
VSEPEPATTEQTRSDDEVGWRRLSARMLLVHPVREVVRAIPALFGLVIVGSSGDRGQWWWGPAGVAVAVAAGILRWFTTRYRFTPDQVQLRSGLLRRKSFTTPADRVRTVDVTASPLHRVLGLAKVEIGTGADDGRLTLDSLPTEHASRLRAELLHRTGGGPLASSFGTGDPSTTRSGRIEGAVLGPGVGQPTAGSAAGGSVPGGAPGAVPIEAHQAPEEQLLRLDPAWARYAPFALTGLVAAAATLGVAWRLGDDLLGDDREAGVAEWTAERVESVGLLAALLVGLALLLVLIIVLSVVGYLLTYWDLRLTRHRQGTLHVSRGLLTTRATSIEERRLRGVELAEPLLLRAVGAARLSAITTGLKSGESALLVPPAPAEVARGVAGRVTRQPGTLAHPLTPHGPAARQRRYVRAVAPLLVLAVGALVGWTRGAPGWIPVVLIVLLALSPLVAADRYRGLGHAVVGRYLVASSGSLARERSVLEREGIIGWNLEQTFFQRRSGLATLTATTAAGDEAYEVLDVPLPEAVRLAEEAVPGLLQPFLTHSTTRHT